MKKTLYAGSFDPITNGHLDMIRRGAKLTDQLVIGIIDNPAKKATFSVEEKTAMIKEAVSDLSGVTVDCFSGLLAEYVKKNQIKIVLRGLRITMDFEYELQMAQMNARLYSDDVETIFLMTSPDYSFVSSSIVKEVYSLDGDITGLVPDCVLPYMKKKMKK